MTDAWERKQARGRGGLTSMLATTSALVGCILTSVHLVLGGTSSLALSRVDLLAAWPYILGFSLAALGILLHASETPRAKHHIVITISAGLLAALTLPIAWLYFGFAGIGTESVEQVNGLLAAFTAAVMPVVMVFAGGVVSWRTIERPREFRLRVMAVLVLVAIAVSVACIIFARLTFPGAV